MRLIDADILVNDDRVCEGIACKECPFHYDDGCKRCDFIQNYPTAPAIPIPEGATNGDVLKRLLYGKAIITEFIHDVNISVNNKVIGQFDMEWWNSPYKRDDTDE